MKLRGLTWWIDRWRTSAAYRELTLEEQGAYRNLLDEAWLNGGPLPDDDRLLAKACGCSVYRWRKVRRKVLQKFSKTDDGRWRNSTLDDVFQKTTQLREWRAFAGKIGAQARWGDGNRNSKPHGKPDSKTMGSGSGSGSLKEEEHFLQGCAHFPQCTDKNECRTRKRRKAGL